MGSQPIRTVMSAHDVWGLHPYMSCYACIYSLVCSTLACFISLLPCSRIAHLHLVCAIEVLPLGGCRGAKQSPKQSPEMEMKCNFIHLLLYFYTRADTRLLIVNSSSSYTLQCCSLQAFSWTQNQIVVPILEAKKKQSLALIQTSIQ